VYGLEDLGDGKHILSICKNTINLFNLKEGGNPPVSVYKFSSSFLCTRKEFKK